MVSGSRVLVVEDDADLALAYQRMLRSDGYEVFGAVTLREAREIVKQGCPDLVLLDVVLPDGNGIEFCKHIKDAPETQGALVLLNSGQHVSPDELVQGLESGADGYVTKPVQQRVLLSQVRALLRLKASEKELRHANERLLEFNRLKAEFVANMSHELRTPLTAIIGFAQLLLLHAGKDPMSGNQRDKVERILRNGRHLLSLVDDVLDLSKIEAGRMVLHPEPFDLVGMVEGCFGELLSLAEQKGLDYRLQVADTFPMAFTDELRVRQILINLLSNAIKFTSSGHIHAQLSKVADTEWEFAVTDSGIGIGAEDLSLIFDRFRQVDGSSTREVGGTGLGLTIAQQVAELLGGKITVESVIGQGSTFRVRLPLVAPQLRNVSSELGELREQVSAGVPAGDGQGRWCW
jgi:signal transduction histidine kinase